MRNTEHRGHREHREYPVGLMRLGERVGEGDIAFGCRGGTLEETGVGEGLFGGEGQGTGGVGEGKSGDGPVVVDGDRGVCEFDVGGSEAVGGEDGELECGWLGVEVERLLDAGGGKVVGLAEGVVGGGGEVVGEGEGDMGRSSFGGGEVDGVHGELGGVFGVAEGEVGEGESFVAFEPGERGGKGEFGKGFATVSAFGGRRVGQGGEGDAGAVDALEAGGVVVRVGGGVDQDVIPPCCRGDFVEGFPKVEDVAADFGGGGLFGDGVVGALVSDGEHGHGEEVVLGVVGVAFVGETLVGLGAVFYDVEFTTGALPALDRPEGEVGGTFEAAGKGGVVVGSPIVGVHLADGGDLTFVPVVKSAAAAGGPFARGGEKQKRGEAGGAEEGFVFFAQRRVECVVGEDVFHPQAGKGVVSEGGVGVDVHAELRELRKVLDEAGGEKGELLVAGFGGDEVVVAAEKLAGGGDDVPVAVVHVVAVSEVRVDLPEKSFPRGDLVGAGDVFKVAEGVNAHRRIEVAVVIGGFFLRERNEGAGERVRGRLKEVIALGRGDEQGGCRGESGGRVLAFAVGDGVDDGPGFVLAGFEKVDVSGNELEIVGLGQAGGSDVGFGAGVQTGGELGPSGVVFNQIVDQVGVKGGGEHQEGKGDGAGEQRKGHAHGGFNLTRWEKCRI